MRFEERREARQAAQEAAQEVRAAYTAAARRHAAEHAAAAAAAAAESHAAAASRDAGGRFSSGGGAPNGGQQYPTEPLLEPLSRRPHPQQQRNQTQPGSTGQGGGSRRSPWGGSVTASQAALAAFELGPVERGRGGVTPLSLAVSLATFMVSRALVGTACFVAGVAYADALQGDRGQRQRALRSLHRTTLRLMHRVHARCAPLMHALTQRCTLWWAQLQQWVAGVAIAGAAGAIPVITALGTSVRASLAPARKSKGRGRRHLYAEEEEEEEETAEEDGHQLHGMPVRRAPHATGGLLPSSDDVIMRNSYGDLTGTLSPRSVEDAPVAPPSRRASSLGPGPQSPGLAAREGGGLQDGDDLAEDGGNQPDLATQAEALSRAVRAAAARQAALDAAQTQLMLREMHSPGASAHGPAAALVQGGGASPLSAETTSSLRAALQHDAARAATAAAAPRQTSNAGGAGGEYRLSTPGLDADEEVFAREAVAQKQRADAQAAVLAARARLAEVVAMTQRSASTMES
jgi:hypothetical protein